MKTPSTIISKRWFMLQLSLPAIVILVLFEIIPIGLGTWTSLHDWRIYDPENYSFVGIRHYVNILSEPTFWSVIVLNTVVYMVVTLIFQLFLGTGIAFLLNREFRGKTIVNTILLVPLMIAPVVAGISFSWLFNGEFGIISLLMSSVGLPSAWLSTRWLAMGVVIIANVWTWTPWVTLLVMAGLATEPEAPKEAAYLDGAKSWHVFRYVTLPYLVPIFVTIILLRVFDLLREFDLIWTITSGGPGGLTETLSVYASKEFLVYLHMGKGAAVSLLNAGIVMLVGLLGYRFFSSAVGREY